MSRARPPDPVRGLITPDLLERARGVRLLSCDMDVRVGGGYRIAFGDGPATAMEFFGKYIDVVPNARLVWTNDEGEDGAVTTVTFEERDGKTLLTYRELFASKEALDAEGGGIMPEQLDQLDALLASQSR